MPTFYWKFDGIFDQEHPQPLQGGIELYGVLNSLNFRETLDQNNIFNLPSHGSRTRCHVQFQYNHVSVTRCLTYPLPQKKKRTMFHKTPGVRPLRLSPSLGVGGQHGGCQPTQSIPPFRMQGRRRSGQPLHFLYRPYELYARLGAFGQIIVLCIFGNVFNCYMLLLLCMFNCYICLILFVSVCDLKNGCLYHFISVPIFSPG